MATSPAKSRRHAGSFPKYHLVVVKVGRVVATLDLMSLASGFSFSSVMKSGATAQLDALEGTLNTAEGHFSMADDAEKIETDFSRLLEGNGCAAFDQDAQVAIDSKLDTIDETPWSLRGRKSQLPPTRSVFLKPDLSGQR